MNYTELEKTMSLAGHVAVVTGDFSEESIGRAVALSLLARDATIVFLSNDNSDKDCLSILQEGDKGEAIKANLLDKTEIKRVLDDVIKRYNRLDILINCTDTFYSGAVMTADENIWDESYRVNVLSAFELINAAIPYMKKTGGAILNVTCGVYASALPEISPYLSSVFATVRMMKNFADEVSKNKIRFNTLCAGNIRAKALLEAAKTSDEADVLAEAAAQNYLGRTGTPQDVGEAAAFIVSPAARFVNAATIMLDGGGQDKGLH